MNIVIVGDGKVGYSLAELLEGEGHDITIIDRDAAALERAMESLDVMSIQGNGASALVLKEARVWDSDMLIAATSADELNLLCCLTAKTLGAKNTIARVRNPEYLDQISMLKEQFGLSMVINPDLEAAREIARVINFSPALRVDTFSEGQVELIEIRVNTGSPLSGKKLSQLPTATDSRVLICAVERGDEVYIPGGEFMLEDDDRIHITGETRDIASFLSSLGENNVKLRNIMIVGGGRICYYLCKILDDRSYNIKIIEKDRTRCNELCELLPRAAVVNADGADMEILDSEGLGGMDVLIALTGMDEENLIMSMVASSKKVPKIVTKAARFRQFSIIKQMGIDTVVDPKMAATSQIVQYVRAFGNSRTSDIKTLYKILGGRAEALEFSVTGQTRHMAIPLRLLKLKKNLLISAIVRKGMVIIPHGQDTIMEGDSVIVVTSGHFLEELNDIFRE